MSSEGNQTQKVTLGCLLLQLSEVETFLEQKQVSGFPGRAGMRPGISCFMAPGFTLRVIKMSGN